MIRYIFRNSCIFLAIAAPLIASVQPVRLRCEMLENPLGIDANTPRLSWALASDQRDQRQTAYQVLAASTPELLAADNGDLWNSGKIASSETLHIPYGGKPLESGRTVWWKIRSQDASGTVGTWSEAATFEMGLLAPAEWGAQWIGRTKNAESAPAPLLRTEFPIKGTIKRARAYVCGLGYYELRINGEKIGDHLLDPAYTDFDKRVVTVTHDITAALKSGDNAIGVILGNGWYNVQTKAVWNFDQAPWRSAPKLLLRIEVDTTDGKRRTLVSDGSWRTADGPITFNNIYSGETYDARLEQPGWDTSGFDDAKWDKAQVVNPPKGELVAQAMPPIRATKIFAPKSVKEVKPGVFVFDLGQNISGVPKLNISGPAGTEISMKCSDMLNEDGTVDLRDVGKHIRSHDGRSQTDVYILKGEGRETYTPRFTYHGFQWVEVTGAPGLLDANTIEGVFIHTDVKQSGTFECSNPLINQILELACWSYLGNMHSIFTDCPQREKNGWTGDAHLAAELGLFNYDAATVYRKYMQDVGDAVLPGERLSVIVPNSGWGLNFGPHFAPAWDAVLFEIPWTVYEFTGDTLILKDHYEQMKTYMAFIQTKAKDGIIEESFLGDWMPSKTSTPETVTSTLCYYRDADIISKVAGFLGEEADQKEFANLAAKIAVAFNKKFLDPETGIYANASQTALAGPLFFGVTAEKDREKVIGKLLESIKASNDHIDAGILGSKYIPNVLMDSGHTDVAYRMASQRTEPSWGWWIEQGATTMWERWDGQESRNHIMFGDIAAWMYKALAGIRIGAPGFRHVIIEPHPVGDLTFAKATIDTLRGPITSDWKLNGRTLQLDVSIPANTTATVILPAPDGSQINESGKPLAEAQGVQTKGRDHGRAELEIGSGTYTFTVVP